MEPLPVNHTSVLERLYGKLIVSCQARPESPLHGSVYMAAMARAAEMGGAGGIRADGPEDIRAIRAVTTLPIIGIYKRRDLDPDVYITPRFEEARAVWEAGAPIIAIDGTPRPRPGGETLPSLIARMHEELRGCLIMADVSTVDEGVAAVQAGADLVATTLAGYTPYSRRLPGPDLELVTELVRAVRVPVIAEGRFWRPEEVAEALRRGAHAVVVGTAITNPIALTRRFTVAMQRALGELPRPARAQSFPAERGRGESGW